MNAPAAEQTSSSAADAVTVAGRLASAFAADAGARDAERNLPHVKALKDSGLLALSVPAEYGGVDAPAAVVAEVFRLLAHADGSLSQIPHSHYTFLEALRLQGTPDQREFFYGHVRNGALFANAQSERGPHPIDVDATTLTEHTSGDFLLSGRKFYCTGALFADWVIVRASLADGVRDCHPRRCAGSVRPRRTILPHLRRAHGLRRTRPITACGNRCRYRHRRTG